MRRRLKALSKPDNELRDARESWEETDVRVSAADVKLSFGRAVDEDECESNGFSSVAS
jgi:hypothetical protein